MKEGKKRLVFLCLTVPRSSTINTIPLCFARFIVVRITEHFLEYVVEDKKLLTHFLSGHRETWDKLINCPTQHPFLVQMPYVC